MRTRSDRIPGEAPDADGLADKLRRRLVRFAARRDAVARFERPIVSFSFDDVPESAAATGAEILERTGVRGTYYVSGGLCGEDSPLGRYADVAAIRGLAERGHEIGCHSFSHLDCARADEAEIESDLDFNEGFLAQLGLEADTFAYPYGEVSLAAKRVAGRRFQAARTVRPGMIKGGCDLNHLPSVGIEGPNGEARAAAWIERAAAACGWLILYTHDVRAEPSPWGCTPETLARLEAHAVGKGCVVLPVHQALRRALGAERRPAARLAA